MDYVEKKASSVEKAINLALEELGIQRDEAEIEIVSEGGFLSKAVVRVKKREIVFVVNDLDIKISVLQVLFRLRKKNAGGIRNNEIAIGLQNLLFHKSSLFFFGCAKNCSIAVALGDTSIARNGEVISKY